MDLSFSISPSLTAELLDHQPAAGRTAARDEALEQLWRAAAIGSEQFGQHDGILDGNAGAGRQMRRGGVGRVADHSDAAAMPRRRQQKRVHRPVVDLGRVVDPLLAWDVGSTCR